MARSKSVPEPSGIDTTEMLSTGQAREMAQYVEDVLPLGTRVGRYVIQHELGRGGGIVYAAKERESGRRVALKALRKEMGFCPEYGRARLPRCRRCTAKRVSKASPSPAP